MGFPAGRGYSVAPCTECALWGGFSSLPGENAENTCQRGASSVDASLRCGKSTDALWQGSSVGQSMRFIPAVSGVQIPPLLPEDSSGSGQSRTAFLLWPEPAERLGAQWTPTARRFLILHPPRTAGVTLGCRARGSAGLPHGLGSKRKQGGAIRSGKAHGHHAGSRRDPGNIRATPAKKRHSLTPQGKAVRGNGRLSPKCHQSATVRQIFEEET